jgi:hypothetical protein
MSVQAKLGGEKHVMPVPGALFKNKSVFRKKSDLHFD